VTAIACRRLILVDMNKPTLIEEATTGAIIGSFYDVHGALGFGYRELIYALAMERDLRAKGHQVDREVAVLIHFRGEPLARQTIDMIVDPRAQVPPRHLPEQVQDLQPHILSFSPFVSVSKPFVSVSQLLMPAWRDGLDPHDEP
jgi:hypothetical protein